MLDIFLFLCSAVIALGLLSSAGVLVWWVVTKPKRDAEWAESRRRFEQQRDRVEAGLSETRRRMSR